MPVEHDNNKEKLILIVEDSPVQAEALDRILTREGFRTAIAHDGVEGLTLSRTLKPALILSDVMMPVMDGYRMCREIKNTEALRHIPVVLLTQLYEPEEIISGLESGADAYMSKTICDDLFLAKIRSLLTHPPKFRNSPDLKCTSFEYQNKQYEVHSDRAQTLSFLISTYESVIWQNRELNKVQKQLRTFNEMLEDKVDERTHELADESAVHKQAEENLKKSELRFKSFFDKMTDGIALYDAADTGEIISEPRGKANILKAWALQNAIFNSANFSSIATDSKGVIQIFNVGAEKMLGYTAAEVVNTITPADISDPQEMIARAETLSIELETPITPGFEALVFKASRGIEDIYELTYIRKDGSRFPAVVSVTALRDEQDAIIGYLLIGTDNTARKQIESDRQQLAQRLRDHQFYTRTLFECNMDAIMTTDPDGIITDVNKQMELLTACTRDELIGSPFREYFTDPVLAEASINLVLSKKSLTNYELTARARDGKETMVSYNATTFYDRDRKLQGMFAAARDVTERNILDKVLKEKNVELEAVNKEMEDFAYSVSHDLRAPLRAIDGFSRKVVINYGERLDDEGRRQLQVVRDNAQRMGQLIDNLLAFSRMGRREIVLQPLDMDSMVNSVAEELRAAEPERSIEFKISHLPPARGDVSMMRQVWVNLLSNAVKFTRQRQTGHIEVGGLPEEGELHYWVKDDGAGFDMQYADKLFGVFQRLHRQDEFEGIGVGLAIVQRILHRHNGRIWGEGKPDEGATLHFVLPLPD